MSDEVNEGVWFRGERESQGVQRCVSSFEAGRKISIWVFAHPSDGTGSLTQQASAILGELALGIASGFTNFLYYIGLPVEAVRPALISITVEHSIIQHMSIEYVTHSTC